jgi:hypothetical protein
MRRVIYMSLFRGQRAGRHEYVSFALHDNAPLMHVSPPLACSAFDKQVLKLRRSTDYDGVTNFPESDYDDTDLDS